MNWKRWLSALGAAAVGGAATVAAQWGAGGSPASGKGIAIALGIGAAVGAIKFLGSRESEEAAKPETETAPTK